MKIRYETIASTLMDAKIFFTPSGKERHSPEDILNIDVGARVEPYTAFLSGCSIFSMGSFSYSWSDLPSSVKVGRYCSIASNVKLLGTRHPMERISTSSFTYDSNFVIFKQALDDACGAGGTDFRVHPVHNAIKNALILGNDVWVGANVTFKRGVTVGTGAVVAANSVVVKDVPPYAVVGGNPAKFIKNRFSDREINLLMNSCWWSYKFSDFNSLDIENVEKFCERINSLSEKFAPKVLMFSENGFVKI